MRRLQARHNAQCTDNARCGLNLYKADAEGTNSKSQKKKKKRENKV